MYWKPCREKCRFITASITLLVRSGLAEGRDRPPSTSCYLELLPVGEVLHETCSCHLLYIFFLFPNVWGSLITVTTNLYPRRKCWAEMEMLLTLMSAGGNMFCIYYHTAGGVCKCLEILPATARRAMREDAAWGPLLLLKQVLYCEKHYLRRLRSKGICVYCS